MKTAVSNIIIVLGIVSGLTSGAGILPDDVLNATVGGTVTFITSVSEKTPPTTVTWDFIDNNSNTINIITSVSDYTSPQYVDRITFFSSTGYLELRNLALNDSGQYEVTVVLTGPSIPGQTRLNVFVPVSSVTVTVSGTDLVEFNSSVSLSCSSSGSSLSFLWLNGSSVVSATDRVHLTDGGRNLTIVNVSRYDQGPFRCTVSNAVSSETSEPVKLSISFDPDETLNECPGGCIAGIVIAAVVVVVVVVLLVYFLWIKPEAATRTGGEGQDNTTSPQNQELHYATTCFQNKDGGNVHLGPKDNSPQYAEIYVSSSLPHL